MKNIQYLKYLISAADIMQTYCYNDYRTIQIDHNISKHGIFQETRQQWREDR